MLEKTKYSEKDEIRSADHASKMSSELTSIWSDESLLTQRTLIYVAKLLEEQNALLALITHRLSPNRKRKPSDLLPQLIQTGKIESEGGLEPQQLRGLVDHA